MSTTKTTPSSTAAASVAPKVGRPTTRSGLGRNLRLGRKSDPDAPVPVRAPAPAPKADLAVSFLSSSCEIPFANQVSQQKQNGSGPKPFGAKKEPSYRKGVREPLPPRVITRPDRSKKDVVISPMGIERNLVEQKGKMGADKHWHWANTTKYDFGVYDLPADVKSMSDADQKAFWVDNYVQIDLDVTYLTGVNEVLQHMEKLGKVFTENVGNLYINLIFPEEYPVQRYPKGQPSVMVMPSIAALVPLVTKVASCSALKRCVVTVHPPPGSDSGVTWKQWWAWMDHAVPFMELGKSYWRLDWLPQGYKKDALPERVDGDTRHHLNIEWARVMKDKEFMDKMAALHIAKE